MCLLNKDITNMYTCELVLQIDRYLDNSPHYAMMSSDDTEQRSESNSNTISKKFKFFEQPRIFAQHI